MKSSQSDELKDFLLSKHQPVSTNQVDWEERRRHWIEELEKLYQKIHELLADSIVDGLVTVLRSEKKMEEEYLGKYSAPELMLNVSGEAVRFSPKGRNIIGAKGRVDLVGELDAVTLVMEPAGHWSVVLSRVPRDIVAFTAVRL